MGGPGAGQIIGGKYELDLLLGRGGMGSVWAAEHRDLGSRVAVKFMSAELVNNPQARARFEREARAAAQISSPHIVHVYDHGLHEGTPYIVMEMLEGEDLGSRIQRGGPIPLPEAKRIVHQIAKGLERAHESGFVHRDLKPANVFLCTRDDDMVKILDFGVARPVQRSGEGEVTTTGMLLGSPQYMSPEQARGRPIDSRSDVWALGVVAYRMVTGARPFLGTEVGDIIVRISVDPHTPATQNLPTLPDEVNAFFDRALAKRKEDRFQTATELSEAFLAISVTGEQPHQAARRRRQSTMKTLRRDGTPDAVSGGSIAAAVTTSATPLATRSRLAAVGIVGVLLAAGGITAALALGGDEDVELAPAAEPSTGRTSPELAGAASTRQKSAEPEDPSVSASASEPSPSSTAPHAAASVSEASASDASDPAPPALPDYRTPAPRVPAPADPAPPEPEDRSIFKKRR